MMGIRLMERDHDVYKELYGTKASGIQEAVDSFIPLRIHTIRELKKRFSKNELTALIDFLRNMPQRDPVSLINKETLITHILDSKEWNNLEVKYKILYNELIDKLNELTAAQTYFLQSEIARYWKKHKGKRLNIDAFIETLI